MSIYKYLAPERTQALEGATLRATQASALNDPFELKPFFRTIFDMDDLNDVLAKRATDERLLDNIYDELPQDVRSKLSKDNIGVLLAQPDIKQLLEVTRQNFRAELATLLPNLSALARAKLHENLSSRIGIISFTDDPKNLLMWSHYASEHRGYVIEFDDQHPFFDRRRSVEDEFFHLRSVQYLPNAHSFEKLSDLDGTSVLCVKQNDWAYERERRILVPVDPSTQPDVANPIYLVDVPRECIQSVILGERSTPALKQEIMAILQDHVEYSHVKLRQAAADISSRSIAINDA